MLKNYRRALEQLKEMKDPVSKKRDLDQVSELVAEVVARDELPAPAEEALAQYDKAADYQLPFQQDELCSSPAEDIENRIMPPPIEELTGFDSCHIEKRRETVKVDRQQHFRGMSGFHSSYHVSSKYNIRLVVEKVDYRVETLEHIHSGKRRTADITAIGPDRSKASWDAIAFLICVAISAALPIDRMRKLFGAVDAFSGASICRYLETAAAKLLPIYLFLLQELAQLANVLAGDDSRTRVRNMEKEAREGFQMDRSKVHAMVKAVEAKLGRVFPRKTGTGYKSQLNVSHIHGLIDLHNPRSIVYIFRTHFGSVGDLLSKLLEMRPANALRIIFQGDLSSTNFPNKKLMKRWITCIIGCAAHARRAFFRYRGDDDPLCDRMLELFSMLNVIETQIVNDGRTPKRILDYRQRLARPIWDQIIALAASVLEAEKLRRAKNRLHFLWPRASKLYQACQYIVCHRRQLTAYIYDYRLSLDNNRSERLLRGEKILLVSCKFRWSETGRVAFDVLRSLLMTAKGACGNPYTYFCWVLKKPSDAIEANPELYTPLRFQEIRESKVDDQKYFKWYLQQPKDDVKARPHNFSPLAFSKIPDESPTDLQATGT
jgi:hypothetical protein